MNTTTINAQLAAHIRGRGKASGLKARVRIAPGGGSLQVFTPVHGMKFSEKAQREIRLIAKCNGLSWVRGLEIDIEQMTNPYDFQFFPA